MLGIPWVQELQVLYDGPRAGDDDISPGLAAVVGGGPVGRLQQYRDILLTEHKENMLIYLTTYLTDYRSRTETHKQVAPQHCFKTIELGMDQIFTLKDSYLLLYFVLSYTHRKQN